MKLNPKTHHLEDMYRAYALSLLAANPDWKATQCSSHKVPLGTITRPYDEFENKLKNKRKIVMTYQLFSKIVKIYFQLGQQAMVEGEVLNLGNRMGKIAVVRAQKNFNKKLVDFNATKAQPKIWSEEKKKMVPKNVIYFVSEDYCWTKWFKTRAVKNDYLYEFKPATNSNKGNSLGLNSLVFKTITENPLLKFRYLYYPLVKITKKHAV